MGVKQRADGLRQRQSLLSLQPCETPGSTDLVGKTGVVNPTKSTKQLTSSKKLVVDPFQRTLVFYDSKSKLKKPQIDENGQIKKISTAKETHSKSTEQEAYELMGKDKVSESYWKDYAEQRRLALVEALDENKQLHEENSLLTAKVEELSVENELLKQENETLSLLASKAEQIADLLQAALSEGTDENTTTRDVAIMGEASGDQPLKLSHMDDSE